MNTQTVQCVFVVSVYFEGTLSEVRLRAGDFGENLLALGADSYAIQSVDGDLLFATREEV